MKYRMLCIMIWVACFALTSCAPRTGGIPVEKGASLAVAGFQHPSHAWELLAGHLPEEQVVLPEAVMGMMDTELGTQLAQRTELPLIVPGIVKQCQEILLAKQNRSRPSAFDFWVEVGECVPADYILVPFIFQWKERSGNEWSVNSPAKVVFDLYLIDVRNKTVTRSHYEEEQQSLSENVLDVGTFFKRGGSWITAEQMAREGMAQCLEELGL